MVFIQWQHLGFPVLSSLNWRPSSLPLSSRWSNPLPLNLQSLRHGGCVQHIKIQSTWRHFRSIIPMPTFHNCHDTLYVCCWNNSVGKSSLLSCAKMKPCSKNICARFMLAVLYFPCRSLICSVTLNLWRREQSIMWVCRLIIYCWVRCWRRHVSSCHCPTIFYSSIFYKIESLCFPVLLSL